MDSHARDVALTDLRVRATSCKNYTVVSRVRASRYAAGAATGISVPALIDAL